MNGTATARARGAATWESELAAALADVKAALNVAAAASRAPLFDDADAVDWLGFKSERPRWLVTGLIRRDGVTVIGGQPKQAKKTWLATEIAIAVATGTKVCGEFFAEAGVVGYFYAEDQAIDLRNRNRALLAGANRTLQRGRLHQRPRGMFLDITRDEDLAWLIASARRLGKLDLLILDPLRDISSAAEDKSDEMGPVMRRLRLVVTLLGCGVAVVHHSGKDSKDTSRRSGGQRLRGSGAIHGSTDNGIYFLECDGDGKNKFRNVVESEVKGARSAGVFDLVLEIEDDENGEAILAKFYVEREAVKRETVKAKAEREDDEAVIAFVRALAARGERLSRRGIRDHDDCPTTDHRTRDSLTRLLKAGRIFLEGGIVILRERNYEVDP